MTTKAKRRKRPAPRAARTSSRAAPKTPDAQDLNVQLAAMRSSLLRTLRQLNIICAAANTCALAVRKSESVDDDIDIATTLRKSVVRRISPQMVKLREIIEVLPEGGAS